MAEEGAPFLVVVPAQEQQLPEPPQPANPEKPANPEAVSLEGAYSEAVAATPPSHAMAEGEPNVESKTRPTRANSPKVGAKTGTKTRTKTRAESKTAGKTSDTSKRGKAAGARTAGSKSKGASRKDQ